MTRVAMVDPSLFTLPYDQALIEGLSQAGHDVTLFGRRPGPDDGTVKGIRLVDIFYRFVGLAPVARLPEKLRLGVKGLDHVWSMLRLLARLRRERPDVIHFQWLPLPVVDGRLLRQFRRIAPLVLTVHDTNPFNGDPSSRLQASGFAACLAGADRLIVHTETGAARLRQLGLAGARIDVVPHGHLSQGLPAAHDDAMRGTLTFVLFGKIKPYKGADILLEAFARLPAALRSTARLRIVGKPYMDLAPLTALVTTHGLEAEVSIEPRFIRDDEIPELFGPGTVAVFPYREIDASGVLFQALAQGRPVIASRLGMFAELLNDGVEGRLCAPEDIAGFADALRQFIEDRDFAAAAARAAQDASRKVTDWATIAGLTAQIYDKAIDETLRREIAPARPAMLASTRQTP